MKICGDCIFYKDKYYVAGGACVIALIPKATHRIRVKTSEGCVMHTTQKQIDEEAQPDADIDR